MNKVTVDKLESGDQPSGAPQKGTRPPTAKNVVHESNPNKTVVGRKVGHGDITQKQD